ncbi:MAG TPA: nuclear transport factor 2 family protein [Thermomicrobiales bacterium]|nr:nuclear transport factor 2 family protein [Thermomicrobiales bacterium]
MPGNTNRSTGEVFEDHLRLRKEHRTTEDIERNYADDLVVLSGTGKSLGRDGVRETACELDSYLPNGTWEYTNTLVEGEFAFLEWTATSDNGVVCDGADSFVIRDGRIVFQSIHYTVHSDGPGERQAGQ